MLKLFHSIFGGAAVERGKYPDDLIERAIDRALEATDPRIRALSGHRRRIGAARVLASRKTLGTMEDAVTPLMTLQAGAALALVTGSLLAASPASADTPTCDGQPATIVAAPAAKAPWNTVINGTPGPDVIYIPADPSDSVYYTVNAGAGDDIVCGDGEVDADVNGGDGDDHLEVNAWNVDGGNGDDVLFGGSGDDVLHGERGDDRLSGGLGDDTLVQGQGSGPSSADGGPGY